MVDGRNIKTVVKDDEQAREVWGKAITVGNNRSIYNIGRLNQLENYCIMIFNNKNVRCNVDINKLGYK